MRGHHSAKPVRGVSAERERLSVHPPTGERWTCNVPIVAWSCCRHHEPVDRCPATAAPSVHRRCRIAVIGANRLGRPTTRAIASSLRSLAEVNVEGPLRQCWNGFESLLSALERRSIRKGAEVYAQRIWVTQRSGRRNRESARAVAVQ
jgi:hypothetical protein